MEVRERYARTTKGWVYDIACHYVLAGLEFRLTRTRQTDRLSFVRATNSDLRGLGLKEIIGWF